MRPLIVFHAAGAKADRGEPGLEGAPREHHGRPQQGGESTKLKLAGSAGVGPPKPQCPILRTPSHLPSHQRHLLLKVPPALESGNWVSTWSGAPGRPRGTLKDHLLIPGLRPVGFLLCDSVV